MRFLIVVGITWSLALMVPVLASPVRRWRASDPVEER